jgi:hypothetical protein
MHIFRFLMGSLFAFSAVSKIVSIDAFELYTFKTFDFNWYTTISLVRLLIALEILIAISFITGVGYRISVYVALIFIFLSSLWLIQRWVAAPNENCQCFGNLINIKPLVSLLKNLMMLPVLGFLVANLKIKAFRWDNIAGFLVIGFVSLVGVGIASPPDFFHKGTYDSEGYLNEISMENLKNDAYLTIDTSASIPQKQIVMMMSMSCPICEMAIKKIEIIQRRHPKMLPITLVVMAGKIDGWIGFKKTNNVPNYPVWFLEPQNFLQYTKSLPTLYFVKNGTIVKIKSYRDLLESDLIDFD